MTTPTPFASAPPREVVVVLHGVANGPLCTALLGHRLTRAGFAVVNASYPSRTLPLAELAGRWLPDLLARPALATAHRLHFVAHSMGALVVRGALAAARPANLGRVVMIAPPNQGSAIADRLCSNALARWIVGCNLAALGTGADAFWRSLPPRADFELGIVAGSGAGNPFGALWLDSPNDGTVSLASTHLPGMADHLVLPSSHTGILLRRRTAGDVLAFLRTGRFCSTSRCTGLGLSG